MLWLPVEVAGGLFSVGDTHAAQGDGEVCGTAIESAMAVTLTFELEKGAGLKFPRLRTPGPVTRHHDGAGYDVTTGIGPDLMEGARDAVSGMIDLLAAREKMSPVEAYMLCSVAGDLPDLLRRRRAELGRLALHAAGHLRVSTAPLLAVEDLVIEIRGEDGVRTVVDGMSFDVAEGEILAIAGESGSGKSLTALALMGLLPAPAARVAAGRARSSATTSSRFRRARCAVAAAARSR